MDVGKDEESVSVEAPFPPLPTEEDYNYPLPSNEPSEEELYTALPQLLVDEDESPYYSVVPWSDLNDLHVSQPYMPPVKQAPLHQDRINNCLVACLTNIDATSTAALNHTQLAPLLKGSSSFDTLNNIIIDLLPQVHAFGVGKVAISFKPVEKVKKQREPKEKGDKEDKGLKASKAIKLTRYFILK
jgi:hypothetical protein